MENSSKNFFKEIKDKEKNLVIWNESKISRHFKSKYPELEKSKNKKKFFKSKGKKSAMSTWEDMDNSTSDEEDEEEDQSQGYHNYILTLAVAHLKILCAP